MAAIILQPTITKSTNSLSSLPRSIPVLKSPTISLSPPKPNHKPQLLQVPQLPNSNSQPVHTPCPQDTKNSNDDPPFSNNSYPTIDDFRDLLGVAVRCSDIELVTAVHASILKVEPEDTRLWNALLVACVKLGFNDYARKVFDNISRPDVVSFTALVSGFAKANKEEEAIQLFFDMRSSGVEPNEYSFVAILSASIRISNLDLGSQAHALIIKMGYLDFIHVSNALMGLYGKCGCLDFVLNLFDQMPQRDIASWNTVISSFVKESMHEKSLDLFRSRLRIDSFIIDHFTLSTLLAACSGSLACMSGRELHAYALKSGFLTNLSVGNALIHFYMKCGGVKSVVALFESMPRKDVITWTEMIMAYMTFGLVDQAADIFNRMPEKNSVSYNALLVGFCQNGRGLMALSLFCEMVEEGKELTDFTLTSVVNACGLLTDKKTSEMIQGFILKVGFELNECTEAALLDMFTRCGRMSDAEKMFHSWPLSRSSSIIWTSMICGYARTGQPYESISLFCLGHSEGTMEIDEVLLSAVLGVCGTLGSLELGEQVHCHAQKSGFLSDIVVVNATMSMYCKCGNMKNATKVFKTMQIPDIVSWNGLMAGHILHRQGDETLAVWSTMQKVGVKPDPITLLLILSAYRYTCSNLVDCCRKFFLSMKTTYGTEPTSEHYAALVGVLGYWGLLEEAEEVISRMPFKLEASVWRALLDSCRIHKNTDIGKRAAKQILALEPQDPSTYILVSNLFSASGRWNCSDLIRGKMREKGFRKLPARSWIIHKNRAHFFFARDRSHSQSKDINRGLEILILECLKAGYVPDTSFVLHEVEEHQKNDFLFNHSAKLAVTYGLLMTRPRKPIHVMKNIILCGDCHTFFKYVSVITKREIHVRDASGFHCFLNGHCSCKDYW